ncbi:MAG: class I SAM-dependent methyltransferase [Calothrix sp. MO_167.B12]|nr:class I SAM-dependent methyltransferase [Calothrix sp. MO_167.B12]
MIVSEQSHYNLKPVTKAGKRKKESIQNDLFTFLIPKLSQFANVLEVGSGQGAFANECRSRQFSYVGIEPSKELSQQLRKDGFNIVSEAVPPIPLKSETFDLVHSDQFVEHLRDYSEVMNFFLETYRILKPGGYTSVVVPNFDTINHLFFKYEYQHSYITNIYRLKNILEDCGFEIANKQCFFLWLSPKFNWLDRLLAHIIIPISINPLVQTLIRTLISEDFLFRVHKNMFDQVAIVARKPLNTP